MLVISALLFGRRITARDVGCFALCYAGIALVFGNDVMTQVGNVALGSFWVLLSALLYAIYLVGSGRLVGRVGSLRFACYAGLISCVAVVVHYLVTAADIGLILRQPAPVYWLALLVGRIAAQALLPRVSHGKLLIASCLAAILGSVILITTNNRFGAWSGILMLGTGFAMIYPLAVEKIGHRFPNYHPGFYNGIFSFGIVGGLLAPWTLGFAAEAWGIQAVMLLPLAGTMMVFLLVVLLWIENRLTATATGRP